MMMPQIEIVGLTGELYTSINTLLHTPEGTVINDRKYGLDFGAIDYPPETAEAMLLADLEEKLERYEPSVRLEDVSVQADGEGTITIKVVIAYAAQQDEE